MTIRAVFFDMGGTIETYGWTTELRIDATPGIRKLLAGAGIHFDLTDKQLYKVISDGLDMYHRKSLETMDELSPQQVWMDYILNDYPVDPGILAGLAEDLMLYIETHYYGRHMRPDVPAVLDSIQKIGLKIGLISNVNSRGQVATNLDLYGIRQYFDPVVLSSEYGRRKPDPAIFHHAARLANVPASHCVYIGDRIVRDILGAQRAGFRLAVQILHEYDHGEIDEGATPDAVIRNMTEFVDILRAVQERDASIQVDDQPIRAILFDAGDILYYRPHRYQEFAGFLAGLGIDFGQINREQARVFEQQAYRGQISRDQYREELLRICGVTQPSQVEEGKRILESDDNNVVFFDGVPETLHRLKEKGYLLGIITDTASPIHVKLSWFERGGFGNVWDSIISSKEIGVRKPDPKIYHAALAQLGIPASQAVFVGHKACELDGARAVGMGTIAFNHEKDAVADFYIESFADLLDVAAIQESVTV
jgi:HAD superfamily hydrolase (TIGR01509 family)